MSRTRLLLPAAGRRAGGYAAAVLADSPAAYWRLNEASGASTVVDSSGNGHTGNVSGSPLGVTTGPLAGDPQTCYNATSNSAIDFGDIFAFGGQSETYSVEFWCKNGGGGARDWDPVIERGEGGWQIRLNNGNDYMQFNGNGGGDPISMAPMLDNTWRHMVFTWDGSLNKLVYYNASMLGDWQHSGGNGAGASTLRIGQNPTTNYRWWGGSIAEVAIYTHVLSQDRVSAHYAARL